MNESGVTEGASLRPLDGIGEWYEIPRDLFIHLQGVPGFASTEAGYRIHRTHLPLLPPEIRTSVGDGGALDSKSAAKFDSETEPLGWKLRPYQHVGRQYIRARRGTLLADQQRLGKTPTIIASHDPRDGQLVVVGPLAARGVWMKWMKLRWPNVKPAIVKGRLMDSSVLSSSPLVYMHYDIAGNWQSRGYLDVGTAVFDEAHVLSNRHSTRTMAAMFLAQPAKRLIMATGTPIWNRPQGLHTILQLLGRGAWGNYSKFTKRYCGGGPTSYGWRAEGVSHEDEFKNRLSEVLLRRVWTDVQADLPDTQRDVELVSISPDEAVQLDKLLASLQTSDTPTTIGEVARLRRLLGGLKALKAIEMADSCEEPIVIWGWHNDILTKIHSRLPGSYMITSVMSQDLREKTLENWRADDKPLVMAIGIGQTAIDLSHARRAIFAELDWTPAVVSQAEMRTFHSSRPMAVTYLVADHEIDLMITKALLKKVEVANKVGLPAAESSIDLIKEALGEDLDFEEDDPVAWFFD